MFLLLRNDLIILVIMNISEIKKQMYERFGAGSYELLKVLCGFPNYPAHNLHSISKATGVGYRTVRDIAYLFPFDIIVDEKTGDVQINDNFLSELNSVNFEETVSYSLVKRDIETVVKNYKQHNANLDHISATFECCYKRAIDLINAHDIENCNFLFLGDHDFTSITFALLAKKLSKKPNIVVLDIDEHVLSYIKSISDCNDLDIKTFYSDFRFIIPTSFAEKFDVVFTDPPYTYQGMDVFLTKATAMLKKNAFSTVYISYKPAEQSSKLGLQVQRVINKNGLYIKELRRNYNMYFSAEALGYCSDLYVCWSAADSLPQNSDFCYNIYSHGNNAVESVQRVDTIEIVAKISSFLPIEKKTFYIGDNVTKKMKEVLKMNQFLAQKESGKFHYASTKEYIVDIRVGNEDIVRTLLWCDFDSYSVISHGKITENALYILLHDAFEIKQLINDESFFLYSFKKKNVIGYLSSCIGKRGTVRNTMVKLYSSECCLTQNEAREKVSTFGIIELNDCALYFLPENLIIKLLKKISD